MLIFESTKTNTPIPQQDLAPYFEISAPHVRTQPWQRRSRKQVKMAHKHIQTKANTDKLWEMKQNQHYSPIKKKKQCNLGIRFQDFPLLEFCPLLESCSNFYVGPTSCLIITLLFNALFLWHFPLFIFYFFLICHLSLSIFDLLISVLCTQILSLSLQDTPPYCWLATSVSRLSDTVVKSVFQICLSAPLTWHNMKWLTQQKTKWLP